MEERWKKFGLVDAMSGVAAFGLASRLILPANRLRMQGSASDLFSIGVVGVVLAGLPILAGQYARGRRLRLTYHEWAWVVAGIGACAGFSIPYSKPSYRFSATMLWGLSQAAVALVFQSGLWDRAGDGAGAGRADPGEEDGPPVPDALAWTDRAGALVGPLLGIPVPIVAIWHMFE